MERIGLNYDSTGTKVSLQSAFANVAQSSTDTVLVAAKTGQRIVVLAILAHAAGSVETDVTLNSKGASSGTAICSTKQVAGNGGWRASRGCSTDFLFQTKRGEALTVTTGAGSTLGIDLLFAYLND
jgi:hypothetical protein